VGRPPVAKPRGAFVYLAPFNNPANRDLSASMRSLTRLKTSSISLGVSGFNRRSTCQNLAPNRELRPLHQGLAFYA
jgi:hypothetical protein